MPDSLAGKLLVATPSLVDPNFARTVVLVCAHDENGAFGVVLNRPLNGFELSEHLPAWESYAKAPPVLFAGGPVDKSVAIGLALKEQDSATGDESPLPGGLALVDLSLPPEEIAGLRTVRVFIGYSGWGAGQLEQEIEQEAWFVVAADESDPFAGEPEQLWKRVLQRQSGKLAMFAHFPPDPSLN